MKTAVEATGGMVVQTDTFQNPVFKESLRRVFAHPHEEGFLGTSSNAMLEVGCSSGLMLQPQLRCCSQHVMAITSGTLANCLKDVTN